MPTIKPINNYRIHVSSFPQFNEWIANIYLYQDNTLVVDLRFVANPASVIQFSSLNPNGISLIYANIERLSWFVDTLRNEKPLSAVLYPGTGTMPPRMLLQTSLEPIGEVENP